MLERNGFNRVESHRLKQVIGVIYFPESESVAHYLYTSLTVRLNAVIHTDRTRAFISLKRSPLWKNMEVPETYRFSV
jgi:erythromycin esterase-like protein